MSTDRAVVVVPVADAARVASLCAALRIDADVVPADGVGVAVALRPDTDADAAVKDLSRVLARADVLLLTRAAGQVQAERWRGAALQDVPAPGLLLSGLPEVVERLLLTDIAPADTEGAVTSVGLPRTRLVGALWHLLGRRRPPS